MNDSDKANFARLMTAVAELHNKKLSQQLFDIYWHALKKYEYKDIMRSLNRLIVDPDVGQFMPKPADIVRSNDGDSNTKAILAWGKVMQAIRQVGAWDSVVFDDKKIHAVIEDMGGWIELCRKSTKELGFLSNEFEKRYRAYQYQNDQCFPSRLVGKLEQCSDYQNGSETIQPKYIGFSNNNATSKKIENQQQK
jgi:hypothetical protein